MKLHTLTRKLRRLIAKARKVVYPLSLPMLLIVSGGVSVVAGALLSWPVLGIPGFFVCGAGFLLSCLDEYDERESLRIANAEVTASKDPVQPTPSHF